MDYQKINQIQQDCLSDFMRKKRLYLHWQTGVGKTYFMGKVCKHFNMHKCKTLFICPASIFNSVREALKENGVSEAHYDLLDTPAKRKDFLYLKPNAEKLLVVMSWQIFSIADYWEKLVNDYKFDLFIFDEAHHINGVNTNISKRVKKYFDKKQPPYCLFGSGTPFGNNELELFNAMYCLNKKVFHYGYETFKMIYFVDKNKFTDKNHKKYVLRPEGKKHLYDKVKPYFSYLKLSDITSRLPTVNRRVISLGMGKEQLDIYRDLKNKFKVDMVWYKEGLDKDIKRGVSKGVAFMQFYSSVLSQAMALRQICNGFVYEYIDPKLHSKEEYKARLKTRRIMKFETPKMPRLLEGLKKSSAIGKSLVWTVFKETYKDIEKGLKDIGLDYIKITGDVSISKRQKLIEDFKGNPFKKVFLSHPLCGGAGLNLQLAKYSVTYSRGYSFIQSKQVEGRNYRVNSINYNADIAYIDLKMKGTIEEVIESRVRTKAEACRQFMRYLQQ